MPGRVYLIGAGPGDAGLITVKGLACLSEADVVVYDHLAALPLLGHTRHNAELIYAGKEAGNHTIPQADLNQLLVDKAKSGKIVARLKGGDPFVFGRGGEEGLALAAAGIPFEVVPGVTSAIAAPAYAGIPVTHRGVAASVTFITGHEDPTKSAPGVNWAALAQITGTLVFLMGVQNLKKIAETLMAHGKDPATPVAIVREGTTAKQETWISTLGTVAETARRAGIQPPAVVVVGEVASLYNKLSWLKYLPLFGKKILITRQGIQAGEMVEILNGYGASCVNLPAIAIKPLPLEKLQAALRNINRYQWLLFTSVNAVTLFFECMQDMGLDSRTLGGLKVAAVGEVTARALNVHGIMPDVVPDKYVAESLADALEQAGVSGAKILLPRANEARDFLPDALAKLGAEVDVVPLYVTEAVPHTANELDWLQDVDTVTFTSSSTVSMLMAGVPPAYAGQLKSRAVAACIGPVTAETARKAGFEKIIISDTYTAQALCQTILDYWLEQK